MEEGGMNTSCERQPSLLYKLSGEKCNKNKNK
jgi:hypothetical protein